MTGVSLFKIFSALSFTAFFANTAAASDSNVWLQCGLDAGKFMKSPKRQELLDKFLSCGSTMDALNSFYGTNLEDPACSTWQNLNQECKDFVNACTTNQFDCEEVIQTVISCIPYVNAADAVLQKFDFKSAEHLRDKVVDYRYKVAECGLEMPVDRNDLPLFYQRYCNDFDSSVGFWTLNDEFYVSKDPVRRAELLSKYGDQPAPGKADGYQRIITVAMAMDASSSNYAPERAAAAKVLGTHGDFSAMSLYTLINLAQDREAVVRREAAHGLRVQGNKSFLVNVLLMQMLDDADPLVRGAAALGLRDQAITYDCPELPGSSGEAFISMYFADRYKDPRQLQNGIPVCYKRSPLETINPNNPNDLRTAFPAAAGCPDMPLVSSNIFDRITDLRSVQEFTVMDNICYLHVPRYESKVLDLSRMAVLNAVENERHPVARVQMLAALRNLGEGDLRSRSILQAAAMERDPKIRVAALYALSKAFRGDSQTPQIVINALDDRDPAVRRAAVGAVSELGLLRTENADEAGIGQYKLGMDHFKETFVSCDSVSALAPNFEKLGLRVAEDFNIVRYVRAGFENAQRIERDSCRRKSEPKAPAILHSSPANGEIVNYDNTFEITLHGQYQQDDLRKNIWVVSASSNGQALTFASFESETVEVKDAITGISYRTLVRFSLADSLEKGRNATIVVSQNLRNADGLAFSEAVPQDRKIVFQPRANDATNTILKMFSSDKDIDVRYSIAGLLLRYPQHEPIVYNFLKTMILTRPASNVARAQTFFNPQRLAFNYAKKLEDSKRRLFVKDLVKTLMVNIDLWELPLNRASAVTHDHYLEIGAIDAQYSALDDFLKRKLLEKEVMLDVLRELKFDEWLWNRFAQARPMGGLESPPRYPHYHRLLWGAVRQKYIAIYDNIYGSPEDGNALERLYDVIVGPDEGLPEPE